MVKRTKIIRVFDHFVGFALKGLTSEFVLHQLFTSEPTHVIDTFSSCINLIFPLQPKFIIE